jgi:hypothetical protein
MPLSLPRVTEILKPYTHFNNVPPSVLKRAAARGSTVHALCAGIASGDWVPDTMINAEYAEYVQSFVKWMHAQVKEFVIIETRYTDRDLGYTGQIDFVVKGSDDHLYLVDIKTSSSKQLTYALQLGAYKHLLDNERIPISGGMIVYLDKEGKFPDIDLYEDLREERDIFFSALECYYYFHKKGYMNARKNSSAR